MAPSSPTITTIGYEGRAIHDVVRQLAEAGVERLVDVRIRAQSRKPGFSKSTLAAELARGEIAYEHLRDLGTPLEIRALFRAGDTEQGREQFRAYLLDNHLDALGYLAQLARESSVAILCFEHDERICHRLVVAEELERLHGIGARHLHASGD